MGSTFLAGVTLDGSFGVNDGQFVLVGCDFDVLDGNDANDGEESAGWLPALGAATGVVVENVAGDSYLHFVAWAMAVQFPASEVWTAFGETFVDQWVKRRHGDEVSRSKIGA
jgi:hypothetical protein